MKYVINGKFLTQKQTGVQRYAYEIINELDKIVEPNKIEILTPKSVNNMPNYKNIKVILYGKLNGNLWEQISYPFYLITRRRIGINLGNVAPLIKPDYVCMHDMNFRANPNFFDKKFVRWYRIQMLNIKYRAKHIFTVSEFSKSEMIKYYKINPKRITVIYNGWQHMQRIKSDINIFNKFPELKKNQYIFTLSSLAPNKNINWIINNAKVNPNLKYAIAGGLDLKVYGKKQEFEIPDNLIFLGYVTDSEAKALLENAKVFIFPTLYEGFGIPPLESLSLNTKIIVSDIPCMHEIYGKSAIYIDPFNYQININEILSTLSTKDANFSKILEKYNWSKSAINLNNIMRKN